MPAFALSPSDKVRCGSPIFMPAAQVTFDPTSCHSIRVVRSTAASYVSARELSDATQGDRRFWHKWELGVDFVCLKLGARFPRVYLTAAGVRRAAAEWKDAAPWIETELVPLLQQ